MVALDSLYHGGIRQPMVALHCLYHVVLVVHSLYFSGIGQSVSVWHWMVCTLWY